MSTNTTRPSLKNRPLPQVALDYQDSERFWQSAKQRALELQRCDECGRFRYYPGTICHYCGSDRYTWAPISGRGTVYSYTTLLRAKGNPFEGDLPIVVVLVTLEEGPVMLSDLVDYEPEDLRIGLPVTIEYGDIDEQYTLPLFTPARGER
ncbi:MAG TPA: OB-fold domain-containing protein [Cellulomonas sp.]